MKAGKTVKAFRVQRRDDASIGGELTSLPWQELACGEVTIQVHYSSLNYKDALGISGKGKIFKTLPIIPGIDAAGVVEQSSDGRFPVGMEVLVTGCGLGEIQNGGYAQYISVPAGWVVAKPAGLTLRQAMALGTAGFTAALCLQRLEDNGQTPAHGPFVVTGASGGVGSLAVNMLASLGYEVVAVSGKGEQAGYLHELGAKRILAPSELGSNLPPLASVRWGGAIDNVGGSVLEALLASTQLWGNIACVGLALGADLKTTVMPMILRGVSLLGISSTNCPYALRTKLWGRLATDLKPSKLDTIAGHEASLDELPEVVHKMLARQVVGRYIINCRS